MGTTGCKAFLDQLDSWIEGERTPDARTHAANCSHCRSVAEDFAAISATARTMSDTPEPPAYLWNSIRARLEDEGIIREPRTSAVPACHEFLDQLDSWMDGDRRPDARAHLAGCPSCRGLAEDFDAMMTAARALGNEAAEPPAYLWNSIRAQLEDEGIIRQPRPEAVAVSAKGWFAWLGLPRPALAGVFAAILAVIGLAASGPITRRINDYRWMRGTQRSANTLNAQLNRVEHATVASVGADPLVAAALHKNLAIVDNYISLCEKSVRENPQSEMARDFLYDAYQQKAGLLAQMTEQGE